MPRAREGNISIDSYQKILTPVLFFLIIPDYQLDCLRVCSWFTIDESIKYRYLATETDNLNPGFDAQLCEQLYQHKLLL